jgi:nucleotide-binding universal stress UspA family protein
MPDLGWKRLLCPVDFSPTSESAVRVASALARELGAELTLLHVRNIPGSSIPEGMLEPTGELTHDLSAPADRPLEAWKTAAEGLGVRRVEAVTSVGEPAVEITELARRGAFDAIVIATHARSGLKHAILGSVAEKVVRLAPCVVISVTPEAARRQG